MEGEPQAGGLLGRFENVQTRRSCKRIIPCDAATPMYLMNDYLKPQHLPIDRVDQEANYHAASNLNETRFHRGFHRRHKSDIMPDAARLEQEVMRDFAREERARQSVEATREHKARHTYNILTGEGVGRETEFRPVGKKIVNPFGCMEAVFSEHSKDATNRIKNSKHRFFDHAAEPKFVRQKNLFEEGLTQTTRETAILGYGNNGVRRTRCQSVGAYDNYAHTKGGHGEPDWEQPHYGNRSQIVFG
eukprot:TRINITY_DN837_c0_g1_i1.p1 TRINITY_DN837_c0_g1~~TRINITY_DN837_c0_g1_i1.p1  ORF type:complete len:246 (+),score=40.96 TRINITY_DN837_c0_g1_i1:129-866(+)